MTTVRARVTVVMVTAVATVLVLAIVCRQPNAESHLKIARSNIVPIKIIKSKLRLNLTNATGS